MLLLLLMVMLLLLLLLMLLLLLVVLLLLLLQVELLLLTYLNVAVNFIAAKILNSRGVNKKLRKFFNSTGDSDDLRV